MDIAYIIASFTRQIRFPGRYYLLRHLFPPERFRRDHTGDRWLTNYDGDLKILCGLGSFIEWNIFFRGYHDQGFSSALKRLVKKGMIILDVGANVGGYTILMAKYTGENGKVIAFEPNPEVYDRLRQNVLANDFQNRVVLHPIALSKTSGWSTLYIPKESCSNRGISSLYKYADMLADKLEVAVSTVDDEAKRGSFQRVDLIKIDTEGNDGLVIEGAKDVINRDRPIIIFEADHQAHQKAGLILKSTSDRLRELGYNFSTIDTFGRLRKSGAGKPLPDTNIVCLPGY
ncbi:MAG TPA: FkbM family methyltransferase [Anaerolineales bacterium]|nr:FkbM family methyltransferase [Anaerolineales bacterium]